MIPLLDDSLLQRECLVHDRHFKIRATAYDFDFISFKKANNSFFVVDELFMFGVEGNFDAIA